MKRSPASRVRRALLVWQSAAVLVLPAWLLVGWAAFGSGSWEILLVVLSAGALALALLVVLGLVRARRSVRTTREVSGTDAAVMSVLTLAVLGTGTFSAVTTWSAVVAVLAVAAMIVLAARQLLAETRARMQAVIAAVERDAQRPTAGPRLAEPTGWAPAEGPDAGRTIRLD